MASNNKNCPKNLLRKAGKMGIAIFAGIGLLLLVRLMLPSPPETRAVGFIGAPSADHLAVKTIKPACATDATVLAEYQAWHGLPSHLQPPPYTSTDPGVIRGHIRAAQEQCIDGFVVDWYGPSDGMPNDEDRAFIDQAFDELLKQAKTYDFKVAIMYDEGTLAGAAPPTTTRVISDLLYASKYFTSPAYLMMNGHPALFIFPYDLYDSYINWQSIREQLPVTVTLLDKDPDPANPAHDDLFDGFYAWVQPTAGQWEADGEEWGEGYLGWFYATMANPPYTDKITVGGVWPGFDDTLASWGSGRYMWRRCGQTWYDTWRLFKESGPPYVMIDTWNDFEEGSDIENGIGECLASPGRGCVPPGEQVVYNHTLTNSGKFTDTFDMKTTSLSGWPTVSNLSGVMLPAHSSAPLAITLTVPQTASLGTQDMLAVTATSRLSTAVQSSLVDTTTIAHCIYLPIIFKPAWLEDFDPIRDTWMQVSARWEDIPGPMAVLWEDNPGTYFGKVESEVITVDLDTYPILRVKVTAVDPHSSYTIQIGNVDVLKGISYPGEHSINIADKMGWQGVHSFTINIWISGEGKSATFDFLGFEAD